MSHRDTIVAAALALLVEGGQDAMSTRAVSAAAGVQPPTIYRLFGSKQGLLDAVTSRRFAEYVDAKRTRKRASDPVEDLRRGWDMHVRFGLDNPEVYCAIYGQVREDLQAPAAREAAAILDGIVHRIAGAGRLRVDERTASALVHSAGKGITLTLISVPAAERDLRLLDLARESAIAAVTTDDPGPDVDAVEVAATTLIAALPRSGVLRAPERALMIDWLTRLLDPARAAIVPGRQQREP